MTGANGVRNSAIHLPPNVPLFLKCTLDEHDMSVDGIVTNMELIAKEYDKELNQGYCKSLEIDVLHFSESARLSPTLAFNHPSPSALSA